MVDFTIKRIKEIEYKTHFIKDNIEKVLRLIDILEFIFTSKLKDKLVLKGGTAINIFYANMQDYRLILILIILEVRRRK